jgi:hypothetical protein
LKTLAQLERAQIEKALEQTKGNRTQAAQLLGITFYSLARRLKKFGYPNVQSGKPKGHVHPEGQVSGRPKKKKTPDPEAAA